MVVSMARTSEADAATGILEFKQSRLLADTLN